MRLAVIIIGIALACLIFFQGCTYSIGADAGSDESSAAGVLILVAFTYIVGAGLVTAWPLAAAIVFALSGLLAIGGATSTTASDQWIWMVIAFALSAMSFIGWRGKKRQDAQTSMERATTQRAMAVLAAQGQGVTCPRCGAVAPVNVRFCPNCGLERSPAAQSTT